MSISLHLCWLKKIYIVYYDHRVLHNCPAIFILRHDQFLIIRQCIGNSNFTWLFKLKYFRPFLYPKAHVYVVLLQFTSSWSVTVQLCQVQRQLQLRIEAQGKYLEKIIEEQQKLSGAIKMCPPLKPGEKSKSFELLPPPEENLSDLPCCMKKLRTSDQLPEHVDVPPRPDSNATRTEWNLEVYNEGEEGIRFDI